MNNYCDTKAWKRYLALAKQRKSLFVNNNNMLEIIFDEKLINDYTKENNINLGVVYESIYNIMLVDLVKDSNGNIFPYERMIGAPSGSGIVIVPIYKGKYLLLKQYRHALRAFQLAFPRGYGENGLNASDNAIKELKEELNASINSLEYLGMISPNSGIDGDLVAVYEAKLDSYDIKNGYEAIDDILEVSEDELYRMIKENEINDGFTLSALSLIRGKQYE